MRHKHYDVIVAWAEGKPIQYKNNNVWYDWSNQWLPGWSSDTEYRIKPNTKRVEYRRYMYELKDGPGLAVGVVLKGCTYNPMSYQSAAAYVFVKWIDDDYITSEVEI